MNCIAIIVSYNPNIVQLRKAISSLEKNSLDILLIDNSTIESISAEVSSTCDDFNKCYYLSLKKNMGIAYAHNKGISHAIEKGYEYIVLSDQDTVYPDNFIEKMFVELHELQRLGRNIAAIGPAYIDQNKPNTLPSFEKYNSGKVTKIFQEKGTIEVSQLIASGMLIPSAAIAKIGGMNTDLFIDWVDLEWCWRALNAGYSIYGTFNVKIDHQLGDTSKKIFGKTISIHSPVRNYYIVRNGLHLAFRGQILDAYKHRYYLMKRVIRYFIGMALFSENRFLDVKMMSRGIKDGIRGKLGPLK